MPSMGRTISIGWRSGRSYSRGVYDSHSPGRCTGGRPGPTSGPGTVEVPAEPGLGLDAAAGRGAPRRRGSRPRPAAACDRKNGIDSVAPYAPTSRTATRSPGSGSGHRRPTGRTRRARSTAARRRVTGNRWASAPAGVAGDPGRARGPGAPGRPAPAAARGGFRRRGSRRAGRRPACDRRPARRRRRPGRPGTARARAGPRVARGGVAGEAVRERVQPRAEHGRGRAAPRAPRTGSRARRPRRRARSRKPAVAASVGAPAATVASTWAAERRRRRARSRPRTRGRPIGSSHGEATASAAAARRSGGVHPELAGAVVADEPDPLEPRRARSRRRGGGPAAAGPAPSAIAASRRSSPTRLDRHGADARHRRRPPAPRRRLPGPVTTTRSGVEAGAQDVAQLAARRDVGAEAERRRGGARPRGWGWP